MSKVSPSRFTDAQRLAIQNVLEPVAIRASAGSGKTAVLVESYVSLLDKGLSPSQILAVTFTNEASNEFRERVVTRLRAKSSSEKLIQSVENTPLIGTIHSFCYSVLQSFGHELSLPSLKGIQTPFDWGPAFDSAFTTWKKEVPSDYLPTLFGQVGFRDLKPFAKTFYHLRHSLIPALKKEATPENAEMHRLLSLFVPLAQKVDSTLHAEGKYSFDELEVLAFNILRDVPQVRTDLQGRIKKILLDEFQDTSTRQWEIIQMLLGLEWKKLYFVGDPKQSIYGFREANPALFDAVANRVVNESGKVIDLNTNFRSSTALIDRINSLGRFLFSETSMEWNALIAGKDQPSDMAVLPVVRYGNPEQTRSELQREELLAVVEHVQGILSRGNPPSSIALLFRQGDRILDFEKALLEAGIPSYCKKTRSLFQEYDTHDLVSYLSILVDPEDSVAWVEFLSSSFLSLDFQTLWNLKNGAKEKPFYEVLKENPDSRWNWLCELLELGETSPMECLTTLFRNSSYFPSSRPALLGILQALENSQTVFEALGLLKAAENSGEVFLEEPTFKAPDSVALMTTHAAKGLEFDHVLLVDTLRQQPALQRTLVVNPQGQIGFSYGQGGDKIKSEVLISELERIQKNDEEEAIRILYVAATRAKKSLSFVLPAVGSSLPKNSWGRFLNDYLKA